MASNEGMSEFDDDVVLGVRTEVDHRSGGGDIKPKTYKEAVLVQKAVNIDMPIKQLDVKSALTCLNVAGNFLDADATHHIASALATNSKLLSLNLSQNHIGPEGAKHLGSALQTNGTLSSLNIAGTALGTEGALHIGNALERCAQLLTLDISASSIDADGSIHIARALRNNRTIAKLIFSGDDVRGRSKPATMEVGMVALDVSGKYLMTSGANIFAAFLPRCRCVS